MASAKEQRNISTYIFLHLNTTCLPKEGECRVTELCLLAVNKNDLHKKSFEFPRVTNKLVLCLNPEREILHKATEISYLTNEKLIHQQSFTSKTASQIKFFLKHLEEPVCLVAHYGNGFDFPVLKDEIMRVGKEKLLDEILCADSLEILRSLDGGKKKEVDIASTSSLKRKSSHILNEGPKLKKSKTAPVTSKQTKSNQGHNRVSPGLKKSQSFPAQSTSQDRPFDLRIYYTTMFGKEPEQSHTAEGFCKALVEVAQAKPQFFEMVDTYAEQFSDCSRIKPSLGSGKVH